MMQILHNSRCIKSRECLVFPMKLTNRMNRQISQAPPTISELKEIIRKLNMCSIGLVRQKELLWIENF